MAHRDSTEKHPLVLLYKGINIFLFLCVFLLCGLQCFLLLNANPFPTGYTQQPNLLVALLICAIATQSFSALRMVKHWQALAILLWIFAWEVGGWGASRAFGFPFGSIEWHTGWKAGSILFGWSAWIALAAFCQWQILAQCSRHPKRLGFVQELGFPMLTGMLNAILVAGIIPVVRFWPGVVQSYFSAGSGSESLYGFLAVRCLWIFFVLLIAFMLCPRAFTERTSKYSDPTPVSILIAVTLPLIIVAGHFKLWPSLILILVALSASVALPSVVTRTRPQSKG